LAKDLAHTMGTVSERVALIAALSLAVVTFISSLSAGLLTRLARSTRTVRWIAFCAIVGSLTFILCGAIAFAFVM
jgi:hypothetical protein